MTTGTSVTDTHSWTVRTTWKCLQHKFLQVLQLVSCDLVFEITECRYSEAFLFHQVIIRQMFAGFFSLIRDAQQ